MTKHSESRPLPSLRSQLNSIPPTNGGAARKGSAFYAYSYIYLIDTDHGIIVDRNASRSNKTADAGAMRKMLYRTEDCFRQKPHWIAADTAYGSTDNLV